MPKLAEASVSPGYLQAMYDRITIQQIMVNELEQQVKERDLTIELMNNEISSLRTLNYTDHTRLIELEAMLGKTVIRKATYWTVIQFVVSDVTNRNTYIPNKYVCWNFASDLIRNAKSQGIDCQFVLLLFEDGRCHAVAGFETIDRGWIYIEPMNDEIQNLVRGMSYMNTILKDWVVI